MIENSQRESEREHNGCQARAEKLQRRQRLILFYFFISSPIQRRSRWELILGNAKSQYLKLKREYIYNLRYKKDFGVLGATLAPDPLGYVATTLDNPLADVLLK